MSLIDKNNIYIAKNLIKADIRPDLMLTVMQLKTDKDIDPRATSSSKSCNSCSSLYQIEKIIHIFEDRVYKFTYYNEGYFYDKMIGEVTHIEYDKNYPDSGYVEVKAYIDEADVERKVYANIKRIPIANIQDAIDITPYESPIDKGDDYKLMILGISAQKVRALVINLKMINDNELDQAVKEVSLIVGNTYKICYNDNYNELKCFTGTLTGMLEIPNLDQQFGSGYNPNLGFVRELGECKYPEYNKYYLGDSKTCCCDGCPLAGSCHTEEEISFYNNTYEKDTFLKLPENMVSDVLLTFNTATDNTEDPVYTKIYLSQIRNADDTYHYEDPADTNLEVFAVNTTIFIKSKNARFIVVKHGHYDSWEDADIDANDIDFLYPSQYVPEMIHESARSGEFTILSEFIDNTRSIKYLDYTPNSTSYDDKLYDFADRFNAWIITHGIVHNGDPTKPLLNAYYNAVPEEYGAEFGLVINDTFYDSSKYSITNILMRLMNPDVLDDFLFNVFQMSLNTLSLRTDSGFKLYDDGTFNLRDIVYHFMYDIYNNLMFYYEDMELINALVTPDRSSTVKIYKAWKTDMQLASKYWFKTEFHITFPTHSDEETFRKNAEGFFCSSHIGMAPGSELYFNKYIDDDVPVLSIDVSMPFSYYFSNNGEVNANAIINNLTIGEILDKLQYIDTLAERSRDYYTDPDTGEETLFSIIQNNMLKIVQRDNEFNNIFLKSLKDPKVYLLSSDESKTFIDSNKTFYMEPIDENYQDHDPKAVYKLAKAFKNIFSDVLLNTKLGYFSVNDPYITGGRAEDKIFNLIAVWDFGHIGTIEIPFSLVFIVNNGIEEYE